MTEPLLRVEAISKHFGGIRSVDEVSFDLASGSICAVIGPNGAGKSTLFNLISGIVLPNAGNIYFQGRDICRQTPSQRAGLGFCRTFQTPQIFADLTVLDNVMVGRHLHGKAGFVSALFNTRRARQEDERLRAYCGQLLEQVGLGEYAGTPAADLAFGQLKLLEIIRAMAMEPQLVLLDEFAAGLTHEEGQSMATLVRKMRDQGATVLLVEHNVDLMMGLSDQVLVLNFGRVLAYGTPDEIRRNPEVVDVYLGTEH